MRVDINLFLLVMLFGVLLFSLLFVEFEEGYVQIDPASVVDHGSRSCVVDYENPSNATSCLLGSEFMEY